MIDPGAPIGPPDPTAGARRGERSRAAGEASPDFRVTLSRELAGPPRELLGEVRAAARRWDELQAIGRELHFARDADSGRVTVQVRDLEGRVLDTLPPSTALEVAAGAPLP